MSFLLGRPIFRGYVSSGRVYIVYTCNRQDTLEKKSLQVVTGGQRARTSRNPLDPFNLERFVEAQKEKLDIKFGQTLELK